MRIVVLMHRGSRAGERILSALRARRIQSAAVIEVNGPSAWTNTKRTWRAEGPFVTARRAAARLLFLPWMKRAERGSSAGLRAGAAGSKSEAAVQASDLEPADFPSPPRVRGDQTNGPVTVSLLRELRPDLLLLGGCGIVRPEVLAIPRIGTLNAHPAWLPDYRGVSVVAWSLWEGRAPGVTIHWVDAGVDTGDVVLRSRVPLGAAHSLDEVEQAVGAYAAELMAEAVRQVIDGRDQRVPQPTDGGRVCPRMTTVQRRELHRRLANRATPVESLA